jgi:hypothetical protein
MGCNRLKFYSLGWVVIFFIMNLAGNGRAFAVEVKGQAPPAKSAQDSSSQVYLPVTINDMADAPNGLQTVFGLELNGFKTGSGLLPAREANTSFVRYNGVRWGDIEPEQGQRNWPLLSDLEIQLRTAAQNDLHVILVVRYTPDWAQKVPGATCGPVRQDKLGAFGDFMYDLVVRYSGAPYHVKHWEIWNEPDVDPELAMDFGPQVPFGCWGDPGDPYYGGRYYATMLKAIYPRIKEADPDAQVLVGGLLMSCNPNGAGCLNNLDRQAGMFFEGILVNYGGGSFDGVAFHNYDYHLIGVLGGYFSYKWNSSWINSGPALIAKANFLNDLLEKYGVSEKYLMNTETALLCGGFNDPPGGPGCESDPSSTFELTKAYYVAQAYTASAALGLKANIWYSLSGWRNSGLLYNDQTPRPAYLAFQFSRQILGDLSEGEALTSLDTGGDEDILGYKFEQPDGRVLWVIWSQDGTTEIVSLPSTPDGVWDVFGQPQTVADPSIFVVTIKPLYVEWNP